MPSLTDIRNDYRRILLQTRQLRGLLTRQMLNTMTNEFAEMLVELISSAGSEVNLFNRARKLNMARSIKNLLHEYGKSFNNELGRKLRDLSKRTVNLHEAAQQTLLTDFGPATVSIAQQFGEVSSAVAEQIFMRRALGGGSRTFRTFQNRNIARAVTELDQFITSGILTGRRVSHQVGGIARHLAADNPAVLDALRNMGPRGGRTLMAMRNGVDLQAEYGQNVLKQSKQILYNSRRIAVTENMTYHFETERQIAEQSRIIENVRWTLSGSHPKADECDGFAEADMYGLGSGVMHASNVPAKPHPQCACWLETLIRPIEMWGQKKAAPGVPRVMDTEILEDALRRSYAKQPRVLRLPTDNAMRKMVQRMNSANRQAIAARQELVAAA